MFRLAIVYRGPVTTPKSTLHGDVPTFAESVEPDRRYLYLHPADLGIFDEQNVAGMWLKYGIKPCEIRGSRRFT